MNHHQKIQLDLLEDDIDHGGLADLLDALREICLSKSQEHADHKSSENWKTAGQKISEIIPVIQTLVG